MDTTTTSTIGGTDDGFSFSTGYVSCMKVDGQPILPPLMTEKRREEMRQYKEQAILREKQLKENRSNQTLHIKCLETSAQSTSSFAKRLASTCSTNSKDLPELRESRSVSTSPTPGIPATSTPRVRRTYFVDKEPSPTKEFSGTTSPTEPLPNDSSDVPEGVLRERKITVPTLDLNKSMSSVPSADGSSALSYDGDEEKVDGDPSESDEHKSDDNFASAASSTGTFVIRRSSENKSLEETVRKADVLESYASSTDEDHENSRRDPPQTVVRKPSSEDVVFTRKRPAKYFDIEDEETDKCSTFSSIPNYVPESHKTSLAADSSGTSSKFSPVPITNFSSLAKSLANEFTKKFCATTTSEYSSTTSTANQNVNTKPKGSYDVRLTTDIPSSAEKVRDDDVISNSSDKENIDTSTSSKHVRKLSYTLASPSAALLEAVSKSKDKLFVQNLETVPSASNSEGVQSAFQTPEKCNIKELENNPPSFQDAKESEIGRGQTTGNISKGLSGLSLGSGKQAHMERFLGDQENISKKAVVPEGESPQSARVVEGIQQILTKMQVEHETQLRRLAEQHRLQELRIRQEFESEMEKLKEKFSSTFDSTNSSRSYSKASPNSLVDSVNNSARTPPQTNTTVSESRSLALPISEEGTINTTNSEKVISGQSTLSEQQDQSKVKDSSVFHFTGGNSLMGETQSTSTSTFLNSGIGSTELSGVGLSKLQSRMLLMSPKLFRTPVDARSPLLKGLLFLDPLDKPAAPLRIPKKALEPHMKPKFDRVCAAVKGFLTRRLLNTEKVQIIVQTIRDTVDLLLKLYSEAPSSGDTPFVKPQDTDLHQRLIQQLTGACRSFHDVFFKLSIKERMAIISTDREKLKAKALRSMASPARPNISNATLKSIERRMSHRSSPKRDNRKSRSAKAAYEPHYGSQSVKPKSIKTFNISPKRRRISYWDERNTVSRSTPSLVGKQDLNGNNFRASSGRTQTSSRAVQGTGRSYQPSGAGGLGETFIVPSAMQASRTTLGLSNTGSVKSYIMGPPPSRRDSNAPSNSKSISARSGQSSISMASSSSGVSRSRSSTSRQPWK